MSNRKLKSLNFSIFEFMKTQKNNMSFEHRIGMTNRLSQMGKELFGCGYMPTRIGRIKPKHIEALVSQWKNDGLSPGTIKNRMSDLRFVCKSFHRASVVKSNDEYGIDKRSYIPKENKAIFNADFKKIQDPHLRISLEMQKVFGLRKEECLKIMPHLADKGDSRRQKGSWTKGNVEREVPIRTEAQRQALEKAKAFVSRNQSLIPEGKTYIKQRHLYDRETRAIELKNCHGFRHAYAQKRYKELTGLESPINGGPSKKDMSYNEKQKDRLARKTISSELGHSRVAIAKVYLG